MAQGVVAALAEPQEQPGREAGWSPDIGLRLVAVGEDRVENMRAKAGVGGMESDGKQPAGALLQIDAGRTQTVRGCGAELGCHF